MSIIEDGTGDGYQAKVDSENYLRTRGIAVPQVTDYTEKGDAYILSSGYLSISNTTAQSGVFYLKNTSTNKDYHIDLFRSCNDKATYWTFVKNPTTGSVITTANTKNPENSKFNSSQTMACDCYVGQSGDTFTDGTELATWIQPGPGHSIQEFKGGIDIGPGQSIGVTAQPQSAANVCIMALLFVADAGEL